MIVVSSIDNPINFNAWTNVGFPAKFDVVGHVHQITMLKTSQAMPGARVILKGWQHAAVAAESALNALLDSRREDLIAALGETTGKPALYRVLERMKNSHEGRVCFFA